MAKIMMSPRMIEMAKKLTKTPAAPEAKEPPSNTSRWIKIGLAVAGIAVMVVGHGIPLVAGGALMAAAPYLKKLYHI